MKPLLAATLNKEDYDKLIFPMYVSPKLDGIRALKDKIIFSRTLKPIRNKFTQSQLLFVPDGMDGELIIGDPTAPMAFRKTTSGVMKITGHPDAKLHIFDNYLYEGGFEQRFNKLTEWYNNLPESSLKARVCIVPHIKVHSEEELDIFEQNMVEKGYEGVMLRSLTGKYKYGRSTFKEQILLKLKRFSQVEAVVVGFEERMANENPEFINELGHTARSSSASGLVPRGDLGTLLVNICDTETKLATLIRVGTGFDDKLRKEIWNNQSEYLGKIASIKYFDYGSYDSSRIPVFVGFRDPEDM